MTDEQIREQIHKARIAKNNEASPAMQGIVSKSKNGKGGSQEKLIADIGCSFPIINNQIVEKLGIKVKPFTRHVKIIEASGNSLNLLGSSKLFIQIPHGKGRTELVEAAVLSGNETDSELLILPSSAQAPA